MNKYIYYLWAVNTIFSLAYMYSSVYYIAKQKAFITINFFLIALWPLYFVLHTIAAYMAIFQTFSSPFKWNKTQHGVSATELD